jgi:hypothetical protein
MARFGCICGRLGRCERERRREVFIAATGGGGREDGGVHGDGGRGVSPGMWPGQEEELFGSGAVALVVADADVADSICTARGPDLA